MKRPNVRFESIEIEKLIVNTENDRYVNDTEDEVSAIIAMFKGVSGHPEIEMVNLAEDISEVGLNPFEEPIVWYDDELEKYIVIEGNRRITCIKLMTQYKNNAVLKSTMPEIEKITTLEYPREPIDCVVYENLEEAQSVLAKIHQDTNEGIGRKTWDAYAKQKAKSRDGNVTDTYAIIKFVTEYEKADPELIALIAGKRWTSKLERVVGFKQFKEVYNIEFSNAGSLICKDTPEQVYKMMERLIKDLIKLPATGNFRTKDNFCEYANNLPAEYKTQFYSEKKEDKSKEKEQEAKEKSVKAEDIKNEKEIPRDAKKNDTENMEPRQISWKHRKEKKALRLSKSYDVAEYTCLGEKGKEIIVELESINISLYPNAAAALCRSILEYVVKLWLLESKHPEQFKEGSLPESYNSCLNDLTNRKILNDKQHKMLKRCANKEYFIDFLNSCIHADSKLCIQEQVLIDGWKNIRILIELYIEGHQK